MTRKLDLQKTVYKEKVLVAFCWQDDDHLKSGKDEDLESVRIDIVHAFQDVEASEIMQAEL